MHKSRRQVVFRILRSTRGATRTHSLDSSLDSLALSEEELLLEIERRFGEDLLSLICIPYKKSLGECLYIALAVAKEPFVTYSTDSLPVEQKA